MFQYQNNWDWPKIVLMFSGAMGITSGCPGVGIFCILTHSRQELVHLLEWEWVVEGLQGVDGGHHGAAFKTCRWEKWWEKTVLNPDISMHPEGHSSLLPPEPVSILIPPTAKPLLVTEPQSRAHCTPTQTLHSFETYCVLHRKSKCKSKVTLSHTTSSKTKKLL